MVLNVVQLTSVRLTKSSIEVARKKYKLLRMICTLMATALIFFILDQLFQAHLTENFTSIIAVEHRPPFLFT